MKKLFVWMMMLGFITSVLQAVSPKKWELQRVEQFLQGKFTGVSVSYEGLILLAPREEVLSGPSEEFYLSFLVARDGSAYLGTGHNGKIYKMEKDGTMKLYFQAPEMDVYCLVLDSQGVLYAGTSPNGKIYKITGKDKFEVFFNPDEKYIWDLKFTDQGTLLAAVGEDGGIYEITREGEGVLAFKAQENHILCMRITPQGDLYAGSGGKGRLYRILENKRASILFESPYEEVKAIALGDNRNIYVAAGGTVPKPKVKAEPVVPSPVQPDVSITVTPNSSKATREWIPLQKQPGALYKVNPQGIAEEIWRSDKDLIYSVFWDNTKKTVVFGTGDRGRLFSIDKEKKISLVLQKGSEQIYQLFPWDEKVYILSNNPSGLSAVHDGYRYNGEYLSRVYDTKMLSSWGRIEWKAETPSDTVLQIQTRVGNSSEPNNTWSDWSPPYQKTGGEQILSPESRYIQFRVMFRTDSGRSSPFLEEISLFYIQFNVAPQITNLEILPPNTVFIEPPDRDGKIWGLEDSFSAEPKANSGYHTLGSAKKVERKGYQSVVWKGEDKNGDKLLYSIFIKNEPEDKWLLLKENWKDTIFTFDTLSFPDGNYLIKIMATDFPSNPLGKELTTEEVSRLLVIDNSLPEVENFEAKQNRKNVDVSFSVRDSFSRIKNVEFLIPPGKWRAISPDDGICDSRNETFHFSVPLADIQDSFITIKATDEYGNVGVFRSSF